MRHLQIGASPLSPFWKPDFTRQRAQVIDLEKLKQLQDDFLNAIQLNYRLRVQAAKDDVSLH